MSISKINLILTLFILSCSIDANPLEYEVSGSKGERILSLNALDFAMLFYEDIIFDFKIYKDFNDAELLEMSQKIFDNLKTGGNSKLAFKNFDGRNDLKIIFSYVELKGKNRKLVTVISNFDKKAKKIVTSRAGMEEAWAIWFDVRNSRLIRASNKKYSEKGNLPEDLKALNKAGSYLLNDDESKYPEIERLLPPVIRKKNKVSRFAQIALSQYYALGKKFQEAYLLLDELEKDLQAMPGNEEREKGRIVLRLTRNEIRFAEASH